MTQDTAYEQLLLGHLTAYPARFGRIGALTSQHFGHEMHRIIFEALADKIRQDVDFEKPIFPPVLADKIGEDGVKYLQRCFVSATSGGIINFEHAASCVIEAYYARLLLEKCAVARHFLEADTPDIATAISELKQATDLALGETMGDRFHDSGKVTLAIAADLENQVNPYSTGLTLLDEAMGGGLYPGKAYGIAARKKVGKTILAGTISHNLNMAGVKHLFICGEMGEREIHQRVMGRHLRLYSSAFRGGYDRALLAAKLKTAAREMPKNAIYLDAPGITFERLKDAVMMAHLKYGISGFILDYWQLVGGKQARDSEANHLQEVAQWIAEIGRKLGIWSLTMAQVNQDGNTRGSEGMRLAFDQVYQMHPVAGMGGEADVSQPGRWLEMMDTRYTRWTNIGNAEYPRLFLHERGIYFDEVEEAKPNQAQTA